jgi:hypothetical protein
LLIFFQRLYQEKFLKRWICLNWQENMLLVIYMYFYFEFPNFLVELYMKFS